MEYKYLIVGVLLGTFLSALLPNTITGLLIALILGVTGGYIVYRKEKKEKE